MTTTVNSPRISTVDRLRRVIYNHRMMRCTQEEERIYGMFKDTVLAIENIEKQHPSFGKQVKATVKWLGHGSIILARRQIGLVLDDIMRMCYSLDITRDMTYAPLWDAILDKLAVLESNLLQLK